MKKTITALVLVCCAWFACAQDRTDSMHVAHYDLHLDILDFSAKTINGYVDLTMVSKVNNLPAYVLDLQGLTVDSVLLGGQPATFTHQNLKGQLSKETTISFFVPVNTAFEAVGDSIIPFWVYNNTFSPAAFYKRYVSL